MGEELLQRVLREIGDREQAARAAYEESRRLERALAALGLSSPGSSRDGGGAAPGANRERTVALVRERPGATAGEIAEATGIARRTVSTTLRRLADVGEVVRAERPGGPAGFHAHDGEFELAAPPRPSGADAAAARVALLPNSD